MTAAAVISEVDARWDEPCVTCARGLIGHDVVLSLVLGFRDAARCAVCLAEAHGQPTAGFLQRAALNLRQLSCYRAGWIHADRRLAREVPWPEERVPIALRMDVHADMDEPDPDEPDHDEVDPDEVEALGDHERPDALPVAWSAEFDAGDKGCGELVLELRTRIEALAPGELLRLVARDAGAPEDLPAWCRMTGHRLRGAEHPQYWIERKPLD